MKLAVQALPDLTGTTLDQAIRQIERAGFLFHGLARGSYREWRHPDGSAIWIRPAGGVVRLGPRVATRAGKKYRRRYDQSGNLTTSHTTGETITL